MEKTHIRKCGIYKIVSPSGRVYIGQSRDIFKRWKQYRSKYCKNQTRLRNSFIKYGVNNHSFFIIEECNPNELNNKERYWQDKFNVLCQNTGLNCSLVNSSNSVSIMSEDSKRNMSRSQTGKIMSQLSIIKISQTMKGRKLSDSHRFNISISKRLKDKFILNQENGIFYDRLLDAANAINCSHKNLHRYLIGERKNKTSFRYV